jgi:predicted peroxiredoxin
MPQGLVVKVIAGSQEAERCLQGLTVAATASISGVPVSLWLAGDAAWLADPDRAACVELDDAPDAGALIETVLENGRVTLCARCANRRGLLLANISANIEIAGAASFVAEITAPQTQALVY